jgi:hypothetical protein
MDSFFINMQDALEAKKSALQWRHVKVLSQKSTYSYVSPRNYKENEK